MVVYPAPNSAINWGRSSAPDPPDLGRWLLLLRDFLHHEPSRDQAEENVGDDADVKESAPEAIEERATGSDWDFSSCKGAFGRHVCRRLRLHRGGCDRMISNGKILGFLRRFA